MYYKFVSAGDVGSVYETVLADPKVTKYDPRFVVVTDGIHIRALDTKTKDVLDITIKELINHFDFFCHGQGWKSLKVRKRLLLT
ncbi:MAG: hypothetical protein IPK35_03075 [Saprospiraceae bacterium]|nr:hypothetical protein [Saprospiraceae bacterium]